MRQKNILILGGSRFIGFLLLSELIKKGHNITIFNRQLRIPPTPFPKAIRLVRGDRNCQKDLEYLFNHKYDAIIDVSGYTPSHIEPIIRKYSSKIGHYIFISTTSVYYYKTPPPNPMTEESHRVSFKNTYGGNKALAENLLLNCKKKLPVTIFRPQGVFGPYDPLFAGFVFYRIKNKLPIFIGENKNIQINQLFVFDLIQAVTLTIGNAKTFGKAYNIAGNENVTLIEFIDLCGKICSSSPITKSKEMILQYNNIDYANKNGYFFSNWPKFNHVCSNSLVKKDLKIEFTSLRKSLSKTYAWLLEDTKRLNNFSLRGEKYILYNLSVPFYKKSLWKIIDFFKDPIKTSRQSLRNFIFLKNTYYYFKRKL